MGCYKGGIKYLETIGLRNLYQSGAEPGFDNRWAKKTTTTDSSNFFYRVEWHRKYCNRVDDILNIVSKSKYEIRSMTKRWSLSHHFLSKFF
jgi:hypothetical protein